MESMGDRLRWARTKAGFKSIAEAARAYPRVHKQNLADHEAGRRRISADIAEIYGRKFSVNPGWLLTGHGSPSGSKIRVMGYVGAGATINAYAVDQIDEIEAPPGASEGDVAFVIRGVSMPPFREGGMIIVKPVDNIEDALHRPAVVDLEDGRRFFKHLTRGRNGLFTLLSFQGGEPPIEDVRVTAAAKFRVYVEPE